jgi:hypothetical protein
VVCLEFGPFPAQTFVKRAHDERKVINHVLPSRKVHSRSGY